MTSKTKSKKRNPKDETPKQNTKNGINRKHSGTTEQTALLDTTYSRNSGKKKV